MKWMKSNPYITIKARENKIIHSLIVFEFIRYKWLYMYVYLFFLNINATKFLEQKNILIQLYWIVFLNIIILKTKIK